MLSHADILIQIQRDVDIVQQLIFVFAQDYLLPAFRQHPELPDADIHIHIGNDQPGEPTITFNTHFHMPRPELSVLKPRVVRVEFKQ